MHSLKKDNNGILVNHNFQSAFNYSDGNKIELWEPIDSFFTEMGGETTK